MNAPAYQVFTNCGDAHERAAFQNEMRRIECDGELLPREPRRVPPPHWDLFDPTTPAFLRRQAE